MENERNNPQTDQATPLQRDHGGNLQRGEEGGMQKVQAGKVEAGHSGSTHSHAIVRPQRDMSHIKGWGADLDHKNRPAYPMERTPPRLEGVHWDHPEQQPIKDKIFHSTERPDITPVFGTSAPPRGISGMLRGVAYKYAENDLRHWFLLLFADRVNVVEGLFQDLGRGHVPNVFSEIGLKAEIKHNPAGLARNVAIGSLAIGLTYYLLKQRNKSRW